MIVLRLLCIIIIAQAEMQTHVNFTRGHHLHYHVLCTYQ